ncbi:MAG TPA: hypothetical protein VD973_13550 [Symbiobacteriaceae bacterium]|jgi:hypothetical protein|nr:hypothetical protein [Symbiobacteriaceae bacterium]
MRKIAMMLTLVLTATVALASVAAAAVPAKSPKTLQMETAATLPGNQTDLAAALKGPSPVSYKLLVIDENPADRTAYLDEVLAQWGWPAPSELLLVIYPKANYDLRFALGADFRENGVSVDEMLSLVRSEYFARSQKGDVYGGLAALAQAVNKRMATEAFQAKVKETERVVGFIAAGDFKALLAMAQPQGIHVVPYAVGLPDEGMSEAKALKALQGLVHLAKPEVVHYDLASDGRITFAVRGLTAGLELPASGSEESRVRSSDMAQITLRRVGTEWKLATVAFDPQGILAQRLEAGK